MSDMTLIAPKLGKLIPLLSSDQDGEVIAAVRAISRTLKNAGLDLNDLAKAATTPKTIVVYGGNDEPDPEPAPKSLLDIALWCQAHVSHRLNLTERKFVSDMVERLSNGWKVSQKQQNWLRNIYLWNCGDIP